MRPIILIAAHDADLSRYLMTALQREGHIPLVSHSSKEALTHLLMFGSGINLLIMNTDLPDDAKGEILKYRNQRCPSIPLLWITDRSGILATSDQRLLVRPFTKEVLLAEVNHKLKPFMGRPS